MALATWTRRHGQEGADARERITYSPTPGHRMVRLAGVEPATLGLVENMGFRKRSGARRRKGIRRGRPPGFSSGGSLQLSYRRTPAPSDVDVEGVPRAYFFFESCLISSQSTKQSKWRKKASCPPSVSGSSTIICSSSIASPQAAQWAPSPGPATNLAARVRGSRPSSSFSRMSRSEVALSTQRLTLPRTPLLRPEWWARSYPNESKRETDGRGLERLCPSDACGHRRRALAEHLSRVHDEPPAPPAVRRLYDAERRIRDEIAELGDKIVEALDTEKTSGTEAHLTPNLTRNDPDRCFGRLSQRSSWDSCSMR
jgi:hypothetical protein